MKKKSFEKSPFQCGIEKAFRNIFQLAQNVYTFLGTPSAKLSPKIENRKKQFREVGIARERRDRGLVMFMYQNIY